jgi:hypothetical protein
MGQVAPKVALDGSADYPFLLLLLLLLLLFLFTTRMLAWSTTDAIVHRVWHVYTSLRATCASTSTHQE